MMHKTQERICAITNDMKSMHDKIDDMMQDRSPRDLDLVKYIGEKIKYLERSIKAFDNYKRIEHNNPAKC